MEAEGFPFEAKSEDMHVDIIPKLCDARLCVFPELREPDDYITITYDNTKETLYEGLQEMEKTTATSISSAKWMLSQAWNYPSKVKSPKILT